MKHIASISFGKDSLAMLLRLIEENNDNPDYIIIDNQEIRVFGLDDRTNVINKLFIENGIDVCVWQKCQFHLGTFTKWNEVEIDTFVNFDNTVYNKFVKMCRFQVICND